MTIQEHIDRSPDSWTYNIDKIEAHKASGIMLTTPEGIYRGDLLSVGDSENQLVMTGNLSGAIAIGPVTSEDSSNTIVLDLTSGEVKMVGKWSIPAP